ncbi:hypothetical protein A7982_12237 [Minicystis rosea]|nr:hypothetical protein A7982_12237 [Minicystis rosea]
MSSTRHRISSSARKRDYHFAGAHSRDAVSNATARDRHVAPCTCGHRGARRRAS